MSKKHPVLVTLDLNSIDELFNAPEPNPFSTHDIEILGETGLDAIHKQLDRHWPRRTGQVRLTLRLPAAQIKPGLEATLQAAIRNYCMEQIRVNRAATTNTWHVSWRQLIMAFGILILAAAALYFGFINPVGILKPLLGPLLAVLIVFAGSVSIFDALWSVMFDWIPFVLDTRTLEHIAGAEVVVEQS